MQTYKCECGKELQFRQYGDMEDLVREKNHAVELSNHLMKYYNVDDMAKMQEENELLTMFLHDFCGLVKRSGATGMWSELAEAAAKVLNKKDLDEEVSTNNGAQPEREVTEDGD